MKLSLVKQPSRALSAQAQRSLALEPKSSGGAGSISANAGNLAAFISLGKEAKEFLQKTGKELRGPQSKGGEISDDGLMAKVVNKAFRIVGLDAPGSERAARLAPAKESGLVKTGKRPLSAERASKTASRLPRHVTLESTRKVKPCRVPSDRCSDGSRCGGRAASVRPGPRRRRRS